MKLHEQQKIIKQYYGMNRLPTKNEVTLEIANLQRRDKKGMLDDRYLKLFISLKLYP